MGTFVSFRRLTFQPCHLFHYIHHVDLLDHVHLLDYVDLSDQVDMLDLARTHEDIGHYLRCYYVNVKAELPD